MSQSEESTKGKKGFREWTDHSINIATGCENNCRYCYAKLMADRFNQRKKEDWARTEIRQKEVDKNRRKMNGVIGFPTSHDILASNIDACITTLLKLLKAGNQVVIVSKPRFDLMVKLCRSIMDYREQVVFRFTIGAMDNLKLLFWEPNAPIYEERKASLQYVWEKGFKTSVSIEPMIDSANIDILVGDLDAYVTEDIWIGIMNNIGRVKKGADGFLLNEIARVESGQSIERLLEIYQMFQHHPKIKWKDKTRKHLEKGLQIQIIN